MGYHASGHVVIQRHLKYHPLTPSSCLLRQECHLLKAWFWITYNGEPPRKETQMVSWLAASVRADWGGGEGRTSDQGWSGPLPPPSSRKMFPVPHGTGMEGAHSQSPPPLPLHNRGMSTSSKSRLFPCGWGSTWDIPPCLAAQGGDALPPPCARLGAWQVTLAGNCIEVPWINLK